jgi:hypothetical protein
MGGDVVVDPVAFALIVIIGTAAAYRIGTNMLDLGQRRYRHATRSRMQKITVNAAP